MLERECQPIPMSRLLITGSLAYDFILEYPGRLQDSLGGLHERESNCQVCFPIKRFDRFYGGCGGNLSYSLALLGESPRLLSAAGENASDYLLHLEQAGVDCSCVQSLDGRSATCFITNDIDENRIVVFHGGVVDRAAELSLKDAVDDTIRGCIITPDDVPAMVKFAKQCQELELPYLFDFGSQVTWLSGEELKASMRGALAIFCNEYEFEVFEKKTGWGLEKVLDTVQLAIITAGGEGSRIHQKDQETIIIPACPTTREELDPSGVGDAYRAGFAFGWVRDWSWKQCGEWASTCAAITIESRGCQGHRFTRESVAERYSQFFGAVPLVAQNPSAN